MTDDQHMPEDAACVSVQCDASPHTVWEVLADGFSFAAWVVGASHVRAVDEAWPAPGTRIHHAIGAWPLLVRDTTTVVGADEDRRLDLLAHVRPFGEARVRIEIVPLGERTRLRMLEAPISSGIRGLVPSQVWGPVLRARNRETLGRLGALSERRTRPLDEDHTMPVRPA